MTLLWNIIAILSIVVLIFCTIKLASMGKKVKLFETTNSRYVMYYKVLTQWLKNRNKGIKADEFLKKQKISSIAIYGIGEMGKLLYEELKNTEIKVDYFIDKKADGNLLEDIGVKIVKVAEVAAEKPVEAIVVTPIYDFNTIEDMLYDMGLNAVIISLEDIVYEV